MLLDWLTQLRDWFATLSPEFLFLLALPVMVVIAGLLASARRRRAG